MEKKVENIKEQIVKDYSSVNILQGKLFLFDSYSKETSNFNIIKETSYPVKSDLFISILCKQGSMKIRIGSANYAVQKDDFVVISYRKIFRIIEVSDDFKAKVMCLEKNFFQTEENNPDSVETRNLLEEYPHQSLPRAKMELFLAVFNRISSVIKDKNNVYRKQIVFGYLNVLFYELCNLLAKRKDTAKASVHRDDVFSKFIKNIERYVYKERSIGFYASKVSLSPKYFSLLIFRQTGKHVKDWIDDYVILKAKAMLKSTSLTVQEISYDLNFATPSHFGRYFKHHTGLSPLQYRNS